MKNRVTIIGAGNLSVSIISAMHRYKSPNVINVIDIDKTKKSLVRRYNIEFSCSYDNSIAESDLIFLLAKPKEYVSVLKSLNKFVSKKPIVLSFMAGIKHEQIKRELDADVSTVRCMTNLTIGVSKAFIFYHTKSLDKIDLKKLKDCFLPFGKLKKCTSEEEVDKLTALYGSGPAYYIYFHQIIKNSFMQMGYNEKHAREYTNDLLQGTSRLIENNKNLDEIIDSIASKGGTTRAALSELKKSKIDKLISKAIVEAYKKSKNILRK